MAAKRSVVMGAVLAVSVGCGTSVGLMEPPPTAPPTSAAAGPLNRAPSAKIQSSGVGQTSSTASSYQLRVDAYDPDGDTLTIEWSASEGTLSSSTTTRTTWTPAPTTRSATISVRVTDSQGASASDTTTIVVRSQP